MAIPTTGFGLYAQRGINLLQVAALRIPCFMASAASVMRVAELALRGVSKSLEFIGFNGNSTFSQWVTSGISYVRPYRDETTYTTRRLVLEAVALAAIGIIGNAFVTLLFGPAPAIYNNFLGWIGPIRVSSDLHPFIQFLSNSIFG